MTQLQALNSSHTPIGSKCGCMVAQVSLDSRNEIVWCDRICRQHCHYQVFLTRQHSWKAAEYECTQGGKSNVPHCLCISLPLSCRTTRSQTCLPILSSNLSHHDVRWWWIVKYPQRKSWEKTWSWCREHHSSWIHVFLTAGLHNSRIDGWNKKVKPLFLLTVGLKIMGAVISGTFRGQTYKISYGTA